MTDELRTYVVIRTITDTTGHVDVSVVDVVTGPNGQERAHRMKDALNRTARKDLMEVYIVRAVGEAGGAIDED